MSSQPALSDEELAVIADELKEQHGLYTRRDLIAAATATGSLGVLAKLGIDTTEASHGGGTGELGTQTNPLDHVWAASVDTGSGRATGTANITINVPSDESTVDAALRRASEQFHPREGVDVIVNIESGHTIGSVVKMDHGYYGHIKLQSVDATVSLESGFNPTENLFTVTKAWGPTFDILVDMASNGSRGIHLRDSRLHIENNKGIQNAGGIGLNCTTSVLRAADADFSGAADQAALITAGSAAFLQTANLSGSGVTAGGALEVSRSSKVAAETINLSNSSGHALDSRRGWVFCGSADMTGASDHALHADEASHIQAPQVTVDSTNGDGILARRGSHVWAENVTVNSAGGRGVRAIEGSYLNVNSGSISSSSSSGLRAVNASQIDATNVSISDSGAIGATSREGSTVTMRGGDISNSTNEDVFIFRGSFILVDNVQTDTTDISTGDTNKTSFNSLDRDGVIFN